MTPKEKAEELVSKFDDVCSDIGRSGLSRPVEAKQCALLAVDEILSLPITEWTQIAVPYQDYAYWGNVKKEIEKL